MKINSVVKFWEDVSVYGTPIYEPANDKAFEVLEFLNADQPIEISDARMDRIYDWLMGMEIDVEIMEAPGLKRRSV